jgi:hypothetical protein
MLKLKIPQATSKGYIEVEPNGAFDFAYPDSKTRRGRVQWGGACKPYNNLCRSRNDLCV